MGEARRPSLILAAFTGDEEALRELIEAGADVQQRHDRGMTALHYAVTGGHGGAVSLLAAAGVDVEVRSETGLTVLQAATLDRDTEGRAIASLVAAGADLDARGVHGMTALQYAVAQDNSAAVAALVKAGANLEARDDRGITALHRAALMGNAVAVKMLVGSGASLQVQTPAGITPLLSSVLTGQFHLVPLFKHLGADMLAVGLANSSILHGFVQHVATFLTPDAPRILRELLSMLGEQTAQIWKFPTTPLDVLLLGQDVALKEPQSYFPELIRSFTAAGCPVDTAASPDGLSTLVNWLYRLFHQHQGSWPARLSDNELAVACALLGCSTAAAVPATLQGFCLFTAIQTGALPLLQAVLRAFPHTAHTPHPGAKVVLDALSEAVCILARALPDEPEGEWTAEQECPILHWCDLVKLLLEAGTPPAELVLEASTAFEVVEGAKLTVKLPAWAFEPLSFLRLVVAGVGWSEERHAAFPPDFRSAARSLLLACNRLAAGKRPRAPRLPPGAVARILQLAAFLLPVWVPQLRPFVQCGWE